MGEKLYIILMKINSKPQHISIRTKVKTKAISEANIIISGSNLVFLSLGRFVFLPYQRRQASKASLPIQNGMTHSAAGDNLAREASFILKSNEPAGFNVIDVMAWGALGHAVGFACLVLSYH